MMLAMPVSSSSVRKTKPFAVPGRWRVMTMPATRTRRPWRAVVQIDRAQHAAHRQLVAPQRHRMAADRQARAGVVGHQALGFGHRLAADRRVGLISWGSDPEALALELRALTRSGRCPRAHPQDVALASSRR